MRTRIGILLLVMVLGVSGNVWLDEWTLLYERPNPDRLPVKVNLWFAKNT